MDPPSVLYSSIVMGPRNVTYLILPGVGPIIVCSSTGTVGSLDLECTTIMLKMVSPESTGLRKSTISTASPVPLGSATSFSSELPPTILVGSPTGVPLASTGWSNMKTSMSFGVPTSPVADKNGESH